MQDRTYSMSFGKMLEMMMYSVPATPLHATCNHSVFEHHVLCFGWNDEAGSGDMSEFEYLLGRSICEWSSLDVAMSKRARSVR